MEFFPPLKGVRVRESDRDPCGCRTWLVGPAGGPNAEAVQSLFLRCGSEQGFIFRPPGSKARSTIVRFETDSLRFAENGDLEPFPVREIVPPE